MTGILVAERVGWALRAVNSGCAAAWLEQGSKSSTTLGKKSKTGSRGPHFQFLAVERVLCGGCSPAPWPRFPYRRSAL